MINPIRTLFYFILNCINSVTYLIGNKHYYVAKYKFDNTFKIKLLVGIIILIKVRNIELIVSKIAFILIIVIIIDILGKLVTFVINILY